MQRVRSLGLGVLVLGASGILAGCEMPESGAAFVAQALDSAESAASEGAMIAAFLDGADPAATAEEIAAAAAAEAGASFEPSDCVTATSSGATTTYVLDGCTGPYGYLRASGTVTMALRVTRDGVVATVTSSDLAVNDASLAVDVSALYSVSGTSQSLAVTSHSTATGPRGNVLTVEGTYDVAWDSSTECLDLDGGWSTEASRSTWTTTVAAYRRCAEGCPAAGGSIEFSREVRPYTLTISFDGTATASWESSAGRSGTADLFCSP